MISGSRKNLTTITDEVSDILKRSDLADAFHGYCTTMTPREIAGWLRRDGKPTELVVFMTPDSGKGYLVCVELMNHQEHAQLFTAETRDPEAAMKAVVLLSGAVHFFDRDAGNLLVKKMTGCEIPSIEEEAER